MTKRYLTDDEVAENAKRGMHIDPRFTKTDEIESPEDKLLLSYLHYNPLSKRFIDSYNRFVSFDMPAHFRNARFITAGQTVNTSHGGEKRHPVLVSYENVRIVPPRNKAGAALMPCDARNMCDLSYSAVVYSTVHLQERGGANRHIQFETCWGLLPVMLYSNLCNMHVFNRGSITPKHLLSQSLETRSNAPFVNGEEAKKINELVEESFNIRYNGDKLEKQLSLFILLGVQYYGYNVDSRRNGCFKYISDDSVRFICPGNITPRIDIIYVNPKVSARNKKPSVVHPSIHVHISKFLRNKEHINMFVIFYLAGWNLDRVNSEFLKFIPSLYHALFLVDLKLAHEEYLSVYIDSVYQYIRMSMVDYGTNPMTGNMFSDDLVRDLLFERLFQHMNTDRTPDIVTRKLNMLLLGIAELLLTIHGVITPEITDWDGKRVCTVVKDMSILLERHLQESNKLLRQYMNAQDDLMDLDLQILKEEYARYKFTDTFEKSMTSKTRGVILSKSDQRPAMKMIPVERRNGENIIADISNMLSTYKLVHPQAKSQEMRTSGPMGADVIDTCQTPSGKKTGLTEKMTATSTISAGSDDEALIMMLRHLNKFHTEHSETYPCVFMINGKFMGWCEAAILERELRNWKRKRFIDPFCCIWRSRRVCDVLSVSTDEGRLMAPFLVVQNGEVLAHKHMPGCYDYMKLWRAGYIEFLDPKERMNMYTVYDLKHLADCSKRLLKDRRDSELRLHRARKNVKMDDLNTIRQLREAEALHESVMTSYSHISYVSIHPSTILGVSAHEQANMHMNNTVRTSFSTKLGTQAITTELPRLAENISKQKMQGSNPVYETVMHKALGSQNGGMFMDLTVAVMANPYNEEDSIVVNSRSLHNGLGLFTNWKAAVRDVVESDQVRLGLLPGTEDWKAYRNIDPKTGLPIPGRIFRGGDSLVAMVKKGVIASDLRMPYGECGTVHAVFIDNIDQNTGISLRRVRVILKMTYAVQEGFKLTPPEGQKGVLGKIETDMPVLLDKPWRQLDIIVNPAPFAGRMTINSMLHMLYGKTKSYGAHWNATPFTRFDPAHLERFFMEHGLRRDGMERILLADGRIVEANIFVGEVMSYMLLHHYPQAKQHARGVNGPVDGGTMQSLQGRGVNGGYRFSIMEKHQLANVGCMYQLVDRTSMSAGDADFVYCNTCGSRYETQWAGHARCKLCHGQELVLIRHPYVIKYISDLLCMGNLKLRFTLG
jgi:DNA-directed RNA polymerase beta subunit